MGDFMKILFQNLVHCSSPNRVAKEQALASIAQLSSEIPSQVFIACILAIIKSAESDEGVCSCGGQVLQKHIKDNPASIDEDATSFLKNEGIKGLYCSTEPGRQVFRELVTTLVSSFGNLGTWPELVPALLFFLESDDTSIQLSSLKALHCLTRDVGELLVMDVIPLVPRLLLFLQHQQLELRGCAVNCTAQLVKHGCPTVEQAYSQIQQTVLESIHVEDVELLGSICDFFSLSVQDHSNLMKPHLNIIAEFMIQRIYHPMKFLNSGLFFSGFINEDRSEETWRPYLPNLVPALMTGMIYSDATIEKLCGDRAYEDDVEAVRKMESMELSEDSRVEAVEDDSDTLSLRKCCAASLDMLAEIMKDEILPFLLPKLHMHLASENWRLIEAGVLALGTISIGCPAGMSLIPDMFPKLIALLSAEKPLVRSMCYFTMFRYVKWIASEHVDSLPSLIMTQITRGMLDPHEHVQAAAISALSDIMESIPEYFTPYVNYIMETQVMVLSKCSSATVPVICDSICTLLSSVECDCSDKKFVDLLMPPIMDRLDSEDLPSKSFVTVCETLAVLATELKTAFLPYCPAVFERCCTGFTSLLDQPISKDDEWSIETLACMLDVVAGMAGGLRDEFVPFLIESRFAVYLKSCLKLEYASVLQSAYAVLGDLAMHCPSALDGHWLDLLGSCNGILRSHLEAPKEILANAIWALAEMFRQIGPDLESHANQCLVLLLTVLNVGQRHLCFTNIVYAICNLGLACPESVVPSLPVFADVCCEAILTMEPKPNDENKEGETAAIGMFSMIAASPRVIPRMTFIHFLVSLWVSSDAMKDSIQKAASSVCQSECVDSFADLISDCSDLLQGTLRAKYENLF